MNPMQQLLLGIGMFSVLAAILLSILYVFKKSKKYRGVVGERKIARLLNQFAKRHGGRVIHDAYFPLYDQTTQIDHILIGKFGVLVVETKNLKGKLYGSPSEREWSHYVGGKKHALYNPLMQNKTHLDNIRHIFVKEKIYRVPIEGLVVFADTKLDLYLPKGLPAVELKEFQKMLRSNDYQKDRGVDPDKIFHVLTRNQVTNPQKIRQHNKNVKKIKKSKP